MKKFVTGIIGASLSLTMVVGLGLALQKKEIKPALASTLTNTGYAASEYQYYSGTYYDSIGDSAISTGGTTLLSALCSKIQPSTAFGYGNLWTLYYTSDVYPNDYNGTDPLTNNSYPTTKTASGYRGKIWDMYGDTQYTPGGSEQGASYKKVGDSYNREHTVPQSWFNESTIPQSDPHHIFATDGYVNNQRGNFPYGDVSGSKNVLPNGFGGTGSPVTTYGSCGSSTVFEVEDAYKGDIARGVLYMAAAYYSFGTSFASSNSCFTRSDNKNLLSNYYINLLTKWSADDPVSQKEIDRNNVIFNSSQANRNPFIDHPNWAYKIWGGTPYTWGGSSSSDPAVNSVSVSPSSASLDLNGTKTKQLSATVSVSNGAAQTVAWSSLNSSVATVNSSGLVTAQAVGTAKIRATSTFNTAKYGECTITVTDSSQSDPPIEGGSETITMSEQGFSDQTGVNGTEINGANCTVVFAKGSGSNDPKYYTTGSSVRAYGGNTITISSSDNIVGVSFTFGSSDGSNSITANKGTFTSPDWTGNAKSIVFTIGGSSGHRRIASITITYESSSLPTPTSITATVNKTFYVGETITKSDITVKDNLNSTITDFTFSSYQFTYADADSGGTLTNKTFTDAISYENMQCSLTVQVQRKARVDTSSNTYSISYTDLPTSYQTSTSERTAASGIKYIAYNCANYSSKMQFKASGGYIQTTQELSLKKVTINNRETNTLTVYGGTSSNNITTAISGTNDVYNLTGYKYVKIIRNTSNVAYCSSIDIEVGASDSAANLANYIMYTDTNNQCTSKFSTAKGYFEGLSSSERSTFMTSSDYVISTAKTRFQAWAAHEGKTITYSGGDYVISGARGIQPIDNVLNSNALITSVILTSVVGITAVCGYYLLKRKKQK